MKSPMHFANLPRAWRLPRQLRTRLMLGVTLSLLFHALLLSLQFGIPGLGMPGLELPWSERRAQTPELSVQLMNVPSSAPLSEQTKPEAAPTPSVEIVPAIEPPPVAPSADRPRLTMLAPRELPQPAPPPVATPKSTAAAKKARRPKATPPAQPENAPPQEAAPPQLIARAEPNQDAFVVPAPSPDEPAPKTVPVPAPNPPAEAAEHAEPEAAPQKLLEDPAASAREQALAAQKTAEQDSARQAQEQQAKMQDEVNAKRQAQELAVRKQADEDARNNTAKLAAQKQAEEENVRRRQQLEALKQEEVKKQEQAKAERQVAELEAKKQEQLKAQGQAQELAARKQAEEAARQQAAAQARQKQAEELAAKEKAKQAEELAAKEKLKQADELAAKEKARQAEELAATQRAKELADRQQAEALAAQQREADRLAADKRAAGETGAAGGNRQSDHAGQQNNLGGSLIGKALGQARQLDLPRAETPVRDALPGSAESTRRRSIFGSLDKDVGLAMYIDAWRLKIERNGRLNYSQSSSEKARGDPVVTVAIRSDGSVEEVIINRSSGRPELDEAVRRIVRLNARYSSFPPALARNYDVIEIRRIWSFDDALRLVEEVR